MTSIGSSVEKVFFRPQLSGMLELLKPITWFAPMWALACGVVSSGVSLWDRWLFIIGAVILAGPMACGTSQVVNDWFDRHVDAVNQPERPIPSGRVPGQWGLYLAVVWTALAITVASMLGPVVLAAALVGLGLAWAYSAPPFRWKQSGWAGVITVGFSYETIPWFTGAAAVQGGLPSPSNIAIAVLYGVGAFGIMILNDFKAVNGDRAHGVRSVPVQLGVRRALWVSCGLMACPQIAVVLGLYLLELEASAALVSFLIVLQMIFMRRLFRDPAKYAAWYNATGVTAYVIGMMISAVGLRSLAGGYS